MTRGGLDRSKLRSSDGQLKFLEWKYFHGGIASVIFCPNTTLLFGQMVSCQTKMYFRKWQCGQTLQLLVAKWQICKLVRLVYHV